MLSGRPAIFSLLYKAIVLLCFALCLVPAFSQIIPRNFTSINVNDGLSQSSVWGIKQDKNGFLWIGTADGLNRYDGNSIKIYRPNVNDSSSIKGNTSFYFLQDGDSNLWIIHKAGIDVYNAKKDNFQTVFTYGQMPDSEVNNYFVGEYPKGTIWAWISTKGLVQINAGTRKVMHIYNAPAGTGMPYTEGCANALIDKNGIAWLVTVNKTLAKVNLNTKVFERIYRFPNRTAGLLQLNDTILLIGTEGGFINFNTKTGNYSFHGYDKFLSKELTRHDIVLSIIPYNKNYIWFGTNVGLLIYDLRLKDFTHYTKSFEAGKQTSYNYIQTLYKDRSGNIWIGTNGDGLKKYAPGMNKFEHFYNPAAKSNLVKSIYAKEDGYIYTGMYDNGLQYFSPEGELSKQYDISNSNIPTNTVLSIQPIGATKYLVSHGDRISLFDEKKQSFTDLSARLKKIAVLKNKTIVHPYLYKLKNGSVWFTYADILLSFSEDKNGQLIIEPVKEFNGRNVTCIFFNRDGSFYASYFKGIFKEKNNRRTEVKLPVETLVKSMCQDKDGNIWVGTINGLYKFDENLKLLASFDEKNGLPNSFIYGILPDDYDNLWFSHNKGLSKINARTHVMHHYTVADGLQSSEFNTGAFFKRKDGKLFFGGVNGTNSFFPQKVKDNPVPPKTVITKILLFDKLLPADVAYAAVTKIKLPYHKNILSFDFSALEFSNPEKNLYAYKMQGLDPTWIFSGNKHFARYNLPPGRYVFEVKASNSDGVWNNVPTKILIVITKPYWQKPWFISLIILCSISVFGGVLTLFYRQRYKKQIRELEIQKQMLDERQRISRDLHDHVGTQVSYIVSNIEWLLDPLKPVLPQEKDKRLDNIRTAAKNVMSSLRETIWAVRQEEVSIEEFADRFTLFARNLVKDTNIDLDLEADIVEPGILSPIQALNLYRICQESFSNAVKHADATSIICNIKANEKVLFYMCIKDNGKGFDVNADSPKGHYGLENMHYRAAELGATFKITSEKNKGTRIELSLLR